MPETSQLIVASNRGPVSFVRTDGGFEARRGGGGLVSVAPGLKGRGALWVCAAMTDDDRAAAAEGIEVDGIRVLALDIEPEVYSAAYNRISNRTLWFVSHLLLDSPPEYDESWRQDWAAYERCNRAFADAIVAAAGLGASVVVQDYHLLLVPRMLREARPDLRIGFFLHTPWAPPEYLQQMLPDDVAKQVLSGPLAADRIGFLSPRWARAYRDCCQQLLGEEPGEGVIEVHPLGVDGESLAQRATAADVARVRERLRSRHCGRVVVRIDRADPSKNAVRGLLAFRALLERHPEWVGQVTHIACESPSRTEVPEYQAYVAELRDVAGEINEAFGTVDWQPVELDLDDDFARSLAAMQIADVLVVNPVRDGMNLVAKEGAVLGDAALVLSLEAGAADDLGGGPLVINPFDVAQTADAIHQGLLMPLEERRHRAALTRDRATALPPRQWFERQLASLGVPLVPAQQ